MVGSFTRSLLSAAIVTAGAASAQAAVVASVSTATSAFDTNTSFGAPVANTSSGNLASNYTNNQPANPAPTTDLTTAVAVGQSFTTPAAGLTLGKIEFLVNSGASTGLNFNIYKVSTGGTGASVTATVGSGLLGTGGAGLTFNLDTSGATGVGAEVVQILTFSDADQITLDPSSVYYAEVNASGASAQYNIRRGGGPQSTYNGGNAYFATNANFAAANAAFGARGSIVSGVGADANGNGNVRDAAFAVYAAATPEPVSLSAFAIGGLALFRRRPGTVR